MQVETFEQTTLHVPMHSASHVDTLVHWMELAGPTLTPQSETSWHTYVQRSPQIAPHDETLWQSRWQPSPQEAVQPVTSWHVEVQSFPHTVPQVSPTPWQSWVHPSPAHPKKQSLPPVHTQGWLGSQPWLGRHPVMVRSIAKDAEMYRKGEKYIVFMGLGK